MSNPRPNFQHEVEIMIYVFKHYIASNDVILDLLEDKNIYWYDDVQMVSINVVKTLSGLSPGVDGLKEIRAEEKRAKCIRTYGEAHPEVRIAQDQLDVIQAEWKKWTHSKILMHLFKNESEDVKFVKSLYYKSVLQSDDSLVLLKKHTQNWDVDRIARLDTVIMKMGITEFISFPSIPVKVTMNEYLEISKNYSTEKSRVFINGVLDKVLLDLKNANRLNKSGMGLINR